MTVKFKAYLKVCVLLSHPLSNFTGSASLTEASDSVTSAVFKYNLVFCSRPSKASRNWARTWLSHLASIRHPPALHLHLLWQFTFLHVLPSAPGIICTSRSRMLNCLDLSRRKVKVLKYTNTIQIDWTVRARLTLPLKTKPPGLSGEDISVALPRSLTRVRDSTQSTTFFKFNTYTAAIPCIFTWEKPHETHWGFLPCKPAYDQADSCACACVCVFLSSNLVPPKKWGPVLVAKLKVTEAFNEGAYWKFLKILRGDIVGNCDFFFLKEKKKLQIDCTVGTVNEKGSLVTVEAEGWFEWFLSIKELWMLRY